MPSPNGHRAERDGCGCPPWVLRCAHFEGRILMVADTRTNPNSCQNCAGYVGVGIVQVHGRWEPCVECGRPALWRREKEFEIISPDLPAAEAEFRKREAALLERVHV